GEPQRFRKGVRSGLRLIVVDRDACYHGGKGPGAGGRGFCRSGLGGGLSVYDALRQERGEDQVGRRTPKHADILSGAVSCGGRNPPPRCNPANRTVQLRPFFSAICVHFPDWYMTCTSLGVRQQT